MTDPGSLGRQAEQSDWLDHAARVGFIAYGVVHLLVAWLAVQVALGSKGEEASPSGALHELATQPFGKTMVWAVCAGMFLLVVWCLIDGAFGHRDLEGLDRARKRASPLARACVYVALGVTGVRVAVGSGSSNSSDQGSKAMTAKLMDLPAGQWIVVAIGLGIIGVAGYLAWTGWTEKFAEQLNTEGKLGYSGAAYLLLGRVGYIAKGIALAIVGGLFCYAGITHKAGDSGGLDAALQKVLEQPFGPYLLIAIAVGIASFGLFCFAHARHLDD